MFTSTFDRYLHKLLKIIGDEFDQVVTQEIKVNVMRCPTEAEVRKCSGHTSARSLERNISFGDD